MIRSRWMMARAMLAAAPGLFFNKRGSMALMAAMQAGTVILFSRVGYVYMVLQM